MSPSPTSLSPKSPPPVQIGELNYSGGQLGDFGVAKRLNSAQPMAVSVVGTPLYLSPELCNGQPYNTKSDVWALGVLLYEMCARRAPFQAGNQVRRRSRGQAAGLRGAEERGREGSERSKRRRETEGT
eukprot:2343265-Rhodomonas_salina.1